MLVYQSRNSPAWGRVQPHAFGFRDDPDVEDEVEIDVSATVGVRPASPTVEAAPAEIAVPDATRQESPR